MSNAAELSTAITTQNNDVSTMLSTASAGSLPYWHVNVPHADRPTHCPDFLRNICQKNIEILSTPDERYQRQGWELVKEIVRKSSLQWSCL